MSLKRNTRCYVLVQTHTDVWNLHEACKARGLSARIAPTPREADTHASCGTSLLVPCEERDVVLQAADEQGIPTNGAVMVEGALNPGRDRFC